MTEIRYSGCNKIKSLLVVKLNDNMILWTTKFNMTTISKYRYKGNAPFLHAFKLIFIDLTQLGMRKSLTLVSLNFVLFSSWRDNTPKESRLGHINFLYLQLLRKSHITPSLQLHYSIYLTRQFLCSHFNFSNSSPPSCPFE